MNREHLWECLFLMYSEWRMHRCIVGPEESPGRAGAVIGEDAVTFSNEVMSKVPFVIPKMDEWGSQHE